MPTHRLSWVTYGQIERLPNGGLASPLASVRYRVLLPALYMERQGIPSAIFTFDERHVDPGAAEGMQAEAVIFSKAFFPSCVALAKLADAQGARIIFDICDDHFDAPHCREHYLALSSMAALITCNSAAMRENIRAYIGREAEVIDDPYEAQPRPPSFAPSGQVLKLGWFGNAGNLESLNNLLPDLLALAAKQPVQIHALTNDIEGLRTYFDIWNVLAPKRLAATFQPWSLERQEALFQVVDLIVLPATEGRAKSAKSANRLIQAMRGGKMVVAHPLPAYREFAEWAWLGANLGEGIGWCINHPIEVRARIAAAQGHIAERYAPDRIGAVWQQAITSVLETAHA